MYCKEVLLLAALPAAVTAHFQLVYPPSRGTDDANQKTFPCGGYAQTQNRTTVSTTSFPVALDLEHTHSLISVLLALGNDAGSSFNISLQPTVQEQGPGDFCFPTVRIPSDLNIANGTNGTIQVITDGEGGGGLYNCADITFISGNVDQQTTCTNATGLTATIASGSSFANGSSAGTAGNPSTTTSASRTPSPTTNAAALGANGAWGVVGAAVIGAVALL